MKKVAIIGAGPTGLSLAAFLTHYGVPVEIFEKKTTTTPFSKAMVVHARTLEIFDDIGIAKTFIEQGEFVSKVKVLNIHNTKEVLNLHNIGKGLTKFSHILSIEQSKTEKILVQYLQKQGVTIHWSHTLQKIEKMNDSHVLHFDQEQQYHADYVIGCDGPRSFIRHFLQYPFGGSTVDERFFVADTIIQSHSIKKHEIALKFGHKNFCLLFPINAAQRHYRIIGIVPQKYLSQDNITFDTIKENVIEKLQLPIVCEKTNRFSTYRVHSRYCHFGKGTIFLAGDAAHIHSPVGGRGMNTGIQDAYNLAWKLAMVCKESAKLQLLESYDQERYPIAKNLINTTDRLFMYVTTNAIFSFIYRTFIIKIVVWLLNTGIFNKKIFPFTGMLNIAYKKSNAIIPSNIARIQAGQRLPYNEEIYPKLLGKHFVILSHKIDIDIVDIPCEILSTKDFLGLGQAYFLIIRPDKHIGYIGKDIKTIKKYFLAMKI